MTIEGNLKTEGGEPIRSALVSADLKNPSSTDSDGNFQLEVEKTETEDRVIPIRVDLERVSKTVNIETGVDLTSVTKINVEIKLDREDQLIVANQVEVEAKVVGICDNYFDNNQIIRQSNKAEDGITCTLKVKIWADGKPLADVPFVLEYTGCSEKKPWNLLSSGETRSAPIPGVG